MAESLSRQPCKHILKICIWIMSIEFGRLDEAHDVSGALTGTQRAREQLVRSAKSNRPDSILDMIVVDRQIALKPLLICEM